MNKKHLIFGLIFMFMIFVFPNDVVAKTICVYEYDGDEYYLETTESDSKLERIQFSDNAVNFKMFNNSISLNETSCPKIVFLNETLFKYVQGSTTYKLIFANKQDCLDFIGGFQENSNATKQCNKLISGKKSEESYSSATNSGSQFGLKNKDTKSCTYSYVDKDTIETTVTLKRKSGENSFSATCDNGKTDGCGVDMDKNIVSDFFEGDKLSCPPYIYANVKTLGTKTTEVSVYDVGFEEDYERPEGKTWEELGEGVTSSEFNNSILCKDIISTEPGSFGWLLNTILNYIKIIGPILVVLLSSIDFTKAVLGFDEKAMKEAQSKLIIRLVAAIALFLVPLLVQVIMSLINQTTCAL